MKSEVSKLFIHFPEFKELRMNDEDNSLSSVFGDFGLFLTDLIFKRSSSENERFYFSQVIESFSIKEVDKLLDKGFKYINDCIRSGESKSVIFFILEVLTDFDETIDYCLNHLSEEGQNMFSEIIIPPN